MCSDPKEYYVEETSVKETEVCIIASEWAGNKRLYSKRNVEYRTLRWSQCFGSVTFWYGSGFADPYL